MYVRYAKGQMLHLVGLIDSVRYDLACSYTLLPTLRAFYLCALGTYYNPFPWVRADVGGLPFTYNMGCMVFVFVHH